MDLTSISIPYEYVATKTQLTWQEILYAIIHRIVDPYAAVERAIEVLRIIEDTPEPLIELASLNRGDSIHPYIDSLADSEVKQSYDFISKKWMYFLLLWIYENRSIYEDPLQLVEDIYAEFDYPPCIENFVRYMPLNGPDLGSLEKNTARLYDRWRSYLENQEKIYGKVI